MNKLYVEQMIKMLNNLDGLMDKAARHADVRKFDVNNFVNERMAPDMLPFSKQIQIACDTAKFCVAYLSQTQAPKFEDNEKTWPELKARIAKTNEVLKMALEFDYSKMKEAKVAPSWAGGQWVNGEEYFYQMAMPNLYFHVATAYMILRKAGVEVGKSDFLGPIPFKKA